MNKSSFGEILCVGEYVRIFKLVCFLLFVGVEWEIIFFGLLFCWEVGKGYEILFEKF